MGFEKVPDADSYRYELRIMDGENDIKYYIIPQFALGGHYGVKHYTVADFQIICMSARINGNDLRRLINCLCGLYFLMVTPIMLRLRT